MYATRTHAFSSLTTLTKSLTQAGLAALLAALVFGPATPARAVGSWTPLAHQAPDYIGTMLLLTDGTVMAQGASGTLNNGAGKHWYRLTPDATGSYANGVWTPLADMHHERLYYASVVLRNGQVLVAGGEYTEAGGVDTNTAETYDPVANAWTEIPGPGWDRIGDAPIQTLFDGTVLLGNITSYATGLYDYTTNTWTAGGNTLSSCDEASWALLPDQTVLSCDPYSSPNAEKYVPMSRTWVHAGQTPTGHDVVQTSSHEIGPAVLLPSGQCLFVGATGHTALYLPPAAPTQPGTWQAGPDFPTDAGGNQLEAKDAPGCLMVNGKVLCLVAPHGSADGGYPNGQQFFEYAPDAGGGTLAAAPDSGLDSADNPAYAGRMLALPNGQVLFSNFNTQVALYTPDGGPDPAWKPAVTGVSANADGSYRVTGTQFNGLSQGASYGDDASMSTNYPLVRLTSGTGVVTYARTFNHSTMGVATGSLPVSTNFTTPAGLASGPYQLQVVANGIASDPVNFTQASTAAVFVGSDAGTQGNWKGVYGADGYDLSQDTSANNPSLPAYAQVRLSGNGNYVWAASTTDPRALLKAAPNTTDRLAACWYSTSGPGGSFAVDVNLTDGQTHQVSLYCLDWDGRGRSDAITIQDAVTGATLDTRTFSSLRGGLYLTWSLKGHVVLHVTCANTTSNFNAVLSALFFGQATPTVPAAPTNLTATPGSASATLTWNAVPGATSYSIYRGTVSGGETLLQSGLTTTGFTDTGLTNGTTYYYQVTAVNSIGASAKSSEASATPQASTAAVFVGSDAGTQGNWKGVYGADGYDLSQDTSANNPSLPAYAQVRLSGNGNYVWAASTTDPRALLKAAPNTTDRLAACWYSTSGPGGSFAVDVNLTDGQTHQVSLYCLDWDGRGRSDAITIQDAVTGATLDTRTFSSLRGGLYLTWSLKGHVVLHVTCANTTSNFNAVLSALFFGQVAQTAPTTTIETSQGIVTRGN